MASPLGEAAIAYARHGLAVFPLKARDKVPATAHGVKDATRDEATITTWWELDPDANIGIAAGSPSGVVVLDVDGESGEQSLVQLMEKHGALPMTPAVATGKGFHLYFRMPEVSLANRVAMAPGLDLRSTGGYVVAPPSIHPSGRVYDWQVDFLQPFAAFPHWLEELARQEVAAREVHTDAIPEGQRNDTLFRDASAMRRRGMGEEAIRAALMADPRYNSWTERERRHELDIVLDTVLKYPAGDPEAEANEAWKARQKAKQEEQPEPKPKARVQARESRSVGKPLSDVEAATTDWIWKPYLPLGKLVILDGDPGLGKSTLFLDIAARITRDGVMPGGNTGDIDMDGEPVGIISVEDSLAETIKPRMVAQRARQDRVIVVDDEAELILPDDMASLERLINENGLRFLVIDPLMALINSAIDSHRDQEVRAEIMRPLKEIAERNDCTIAMIRHLNKVANSAAVYRGGGSIGIIGATRSAMIVGKDPADDQARIFAHVKCNLARSGDSWQYVIDDGEAVGTLRWVQQTEMTADQLVNQDLRAAPKRAEALKFLRDMLVNGPMSVEDLKKAAKAEEIGWETVKDASVFLPNLIKERAGEFGGGGVWRLKGEVDV